MLTVKLHSYKSKLILIRFTGGIRRIVGFYNPGEPEGKRIQWSEDTSKSAALKWLTRDGKAPKASTIIVKQIDHVSSSLYVAMCTLAGSGILLAIAFLVFNIAFRKVRYEAIRFFN